MNGYLTTKEAADYRNLSQVHIRQLCSEGKLQGAERAGRAWIIPKKSVEDYVPGPKGFAAVKARKQEERKKLEEVINNGGGSYYDQ